MSFTINTNVASLQAQYYLNQTQNFQSKTINEVTSGLRIVNSGDDPSGLAIANSFRSNDAVLTQGIQNANNGLSQLQIADGGISNISQLLDSARTLATEAASDTFTGDRGVLNSQFQSVLQEINRQSQSIGLNQGGSMAKALNVFIGGGQASGTNTATQNGSVSVDLSQSTVDAKSLGLAGVQATGATGTDLGTGSATSVQAIVNDPTNLASITNNTTNFLFTGPGFSSSDGSSKVDVAVNLESVTDTGTLVTAINQAIQNAGNGSSQQATAFKNANVTASVVTDAQGRQQLAFSSASTAFQVQGADQVASALLNPAEGDPTGTVTNVSATAGAAYTTPAADEVVNMRITGMGLNGSAGDISVALPATVTTADAAVAAVNAGIALNTAVAATGIKAVNNGGSVELVNSAGNSFQVQTAGDVSNALGFGSWSNDQGVAGGAGAFDYNALTATAVGAVKTQNVQVSLNGGATVNLGLLTGSATTATNLATLNAAFQANAATRAAGMEAVASGGNVKIMSSSGENFRLNLSGGNGDAFGFGDASANGSASSTAGVQTNNTSGNTVNSVGAQQSVNNGNTDVYKFTGITNPGDAQTVTLTAVDPNGSQHTLNVALNSTNASNLDQALSTINQHILASNDSTLGQMAAFKQENTAGTAEGIRFMSAGAAFKISLGASTTTSASPTATLGPPAERFWLPLPTARAPRPTSATLPRLNPR